MRQAEYKLTKHTDSFLWHNLTAGSLLADRHREACSSPRVWTDFLFFSPLVLDKPSALLWKHTHTGVQTQRHACKCVFSLIFLSSHSWLHWFLTLYPKVRQLRTRLSKPACCSLYVPQDKGCVRLRSFFGWPNEFFESSVFRKSENSNDDSNKLKYYLNVQTSGKQTAFKAKRGLSKLKLDQ